MTHKAEDISLREADEVQYLLGRPPGWILRWGITIALASTVLLLAAAWIIRYPDVVSAPVSIVTERPAVRLVSKSGGNISAVLVKDKSIVEAGQILLCMENPAHWQHVLELENRLMKFPTDTLSRKDGLNLLNEDVVSNSWNLGTLQPAFSAWTEELKQMRFRLEAGYLGRQILALNQQIKDLEQLNTGLKQQEQTAAREAELAATRLSKSEALFASGAISELDLERDQTNWLGRRRTVETLQAEQWNNRVRINELYSLQLELKQNDRENIFTSDARLRELSRKLHSEIQAWKQNYLITAPASGVVSFAADWVSGQYLQSGQEVMILIAPEGEGAIKAQGFLPTAGAGKVAAGMSVRIRLAGFPYKEYGVLVGRVRDIALAPVASGKATSSYRIEIELPEGLRTDYGRELPLLREAQGTAGIITERRNLLERLFEPLHSAWKNN